LLRHLSLIALGLALVSVPADSAATVSAAQLPQAAVGTELPAQAITQSQQFDVAINVDGASDLAGFQFVLSFDPKILRATGARGAPFLGSTGREVSCADPTLDEGAVRFACVTLRTEPAGVDGAGTIAIIRVMTQGAGTTDLSLSHVKLVHPDGTELPSRVLPAGSLTVTGGGGWGTLPIVLVATAGAGFVFACVVVAYWLRRRMLEKHAPRAVGDDVR
jgi:hypothetical protein